MDSRQFDRFKAMMAYVVSGAIGFGLGVKIGVQLVIEFNFPFIF